MINAALARRPELLLVDELAHSNAPGSRHPKRWQDVEELIGAGVSVWTTLNVQHLESLVDVVWKITGVRVRETVPDSILDRADNIELVDITPDDLIQRLKEGKVYVPEQARRALEHYFSPVHLNALRELALRRTAERVDEQLLSEMQARAISGPMAAGSPYTDARCLIAYDDQGVAKAITTVKRGTTVIGTAREGKRANSRCNAIAVAAKVRAANG